MQIVLCICVIIVFLFSNYTLVKTLDTLKKVLALTEEHKAAMVEKMSEDDIKRFKEADAEATSEFYKAMASLNAFMTGREEDVNVEQQ